MKKNQSINSKNCLNFSKRGTNLFCVVYRNVWNSATKIHCDLKFYVLHLVNIFNIAAIAHLTMLYTALFHAITLYRVTYLVSSSMLVARRKCSYSLFNQSLRMLMVIDAIFYSTLHTEYIDIFQFRYQSASFSLFLQLVQYPMD